VALDGQFKVGGTFEVVGAFGASGILMGGSSLTAASVQVSSQLLISGTGARLIDSGALTVQGLLTLSNHAVTQAASLSLPNYGTVSVDGTASLEIGGAMAGALTVDAGAIVQGIGTLNGAVVDNGTIAPLGSFFQVVGDLTGNGSITVAGQSTSYLGGTTITPAIDFVGSARGPSISRVIRLPRASARSASDATLLLPARRIATCCSPPTTRSSSTTC
jgi:hypothetical protein